MKIGEYTLENWLPLTVILVLIISSMAGVEVINNQGKVIDHAEGVIVSCKDLLGRSTVDATIIQLQNGRKIRVYEKSCRAGQPVKLQVRKGLIFSNTIYERTDGV